MCPHSVRHLVACKTLSQQLGTPCDCTRRTSGRNNTNGDCQAPSHALDLAEFNIGSVSCQSPCLDKVKDCLRSPHRSYMVFFVALGNLAWSPHQGCQ
eukprot:675450-Amphidinium_carterae.1